MYGSQRDDCPGNSANSFLKRNVRAIPAVAGSQHRGDCVRTPAVSHLLPLRALASWSSADRICAQHTDSGRDDDDQASAEAGYAESLVLAVGLRGNLLADCCTRTLAAVPSAGCQLDHRCDRWVEPCHFDLGATQPGTQYWFRTRAA